MTLIFSLMGPVQRPQNRAAWETKGAQHFLEAIFMVLEEGSSNMSSSSNRQYAHASASRALARPLSLIPWRRNSSREPLKVKAPARAGGPVAAARACMVTAKFNVIIEF
ncbi:hypothetical protein EVAR_67495_1 [Eumeta japonica]|uniref:Uncharacterized protein n=1 Tax=Eumeta variegata TaxID=151549 RepID=A0A4C1ZIT1_EUMVA|nr:hypothetical protein EVAR_67495_1 [Eumeta japonica]